MGDLHLRTWAYRNPRIAKQEPERPRGIEWPKHRSHRHIWQIFLQAESSITTQQCGNAFILGLSVSKASPSILDYLLVHNEGLSFHSPGPLSSRRFLCHMLSRVKCSPQKNTPSPASKMPIPPAVFQPNNPSIVVSSLCYVVCYTVLPVT